MSCCKGRNAVGVQSCVVLQGKEMPEALDKGSQPYSRAFRHREMAGYHCLMPPAFPSLATRHKINRLRHFHS